ncbi:MAG: SDR family oxidoreductase [Candidatus Sumerlaeia bacterium]|nr:SDR family oxidoreductase [Candidatus Sumerlaeia bacterium]
MSERHGLVLLTGASGYVGGRLLRSLEACGRPVRCLARQPEALCSRVAASTEVVRGDVMDLPSLESAMVGVNQAYYLVHALGLKQGFVEQETLGAQNFSQTARAAGARKLIYLGGLGAGPNLSPHLRSRHAVGEILRGSGVPTLEFRASVIIGSGSASFEIVRALVQRLPVMITPRWVNTQSQPIAIEDVLAYLLLALDFDTAESRIFEIGGADQVTYLKLMQECARQRGLRRLFLPVPVLTPRLSSLWLGMVTPVHARIGRKLIDGLSNETIVRDDAALRDFAVRPRGVREAVERALHFEDQEFAQTRWSDAVSANPPLRAWGGATLGNRLLDIRQISVAVSVEEAFRPIERIGGETGWYFANALWRIRGFIDLLAGGVGLRRGRRDPERLAPGDTVDFWRVEAIEPARLLRLTAQMKVPGRAWLQFEVEPEPAGAKITQTAIFDPAGLIGQAYWYLLYPVHAIIFRGMLRRIARAAAAPR